MVQTPDGSVCQSRFYDPRVFRSSIVTMPAQDLVEWFEGVDEYFVENYAGTGTQHYRWQDGALQVSKPQSPKPRQNSQATRVQR